MGSSYGGVWLWEPGGTIVLYAISGARMPEIRWTAMLSAVWRSVAGLEIESRVVVGGGGAGCRAFARESVGEHWSEATSGMPCVL